MTSGKKLAPPYSHDAERAVLGSIMITPEVLCDVQPILGDGSAIYDPTHRALYEAMLAADAKGEPVGDMLLLSERVDLDRIGGLAELASMPEEVGHAGHAQHYARIVRSRAVARRLIAAGAFIAQSAREHAEVDTAPLVADCEAIVHKVSDDEPHANSERLGDIVSATMSDVFETMEGRGTTRKRVTTGFSGIDSMTHGLHGGELAILAARPSMGKTSLGGQMLLSAAESGARVAFFSLEVSRDQLVRNWLCQRAGVPLSTLRGGGCNPEQYEAIGAQVPALEALDVELNDTPAMSMVGMRTACRRLHSRKPLDLVVVDYLQLLTASSGARRESRQQEVSEISQGLKALARQLDCAVLALAQLNRQVDQREDHRPRMSDLRESGSIEQEADLIMFLYREGYYQRDDPSVKNHAEVVIGKQRHGATGQVRLDFDPKVAMFSSNAFGGMY